MSSPTSSPQHLASIDALRGFAAIWVFIYHMWNYYFPECNSQVFPATLKSNMPWFYYPTFFLFQYGYYGVTIFFVVSGFCIHWPQARRHHAAGSDQLKIAPFFRRRFWRLYPAYFASLFVASLCLGAMHLTEYQNRGWPLPLPHDFYEQVFGVMGIFYNALFLLPFSHVARSLNGVYWTLIFELQFYLVYPLLLWLLRRLGLVLVGVILLGCEIWLLPTPRTLQNWHINSLWDYFFLSKFFEWYLGVVAAEIIARRQPGESHRFYLVPFGLLVAYSMVCIFVPILWPTRDLAVAGATFFLLLFLLPGKPGGPLTWWMKSLVWLGAFSYSLYLLHLPLLRLIFVINTHLVHALGFTEPQKIVGLGFTTPVAWFMLDAIPLVILASWGFYHLFEKPFMKAK